MKKYMNRLFVALGAASMLGFTGCIEETFPTDMATPDQVSSSSQSLQYMTNSLPAYIVTKSTYSGGDFDWGYTCQMYVRELYGEDFPANDDGYNMWKYAERASSEILNVALYSFSYYYHLIKNANNVIVMASDLAATGNANAKASLGQGYGFRALSYLDMARLFEFRPTGVERLDNAAQEDGVMGITVPILRENMTVNEYKNNPCVPFYTMYRFIMNDLNKAEECLEGYKQSTIAYMDQNVIYGLKARLWLTMATRFENSPEDLAKQIEADANTDGYGVLGITSANDCYQKVAEYAQKAIKGHTPLTEEEWTDPTTGFNTPQSSWLMGASVTSKEQVNNTTWHQLIGILASETTWGFNQYNFFRCIGKSLYDQIGSGDWRKNSWVAPADAGKSAVPSQYKTNLTDATWKKLPAYSNIKFRPGSGSLVSRETGSIGDFPMMRVEEMYFDYFEAIAHTQSVTDAAAALQEFVNKYRYTDNSYTCKATTLKDFNKALMVQRRIEFWGEGINMFDYKRLRLAVTRNYNGTNYKTDFIRLNSNAGYVAPWMNYRIPESELTYNQAIILAPDPSSAIVAQ